MNDPYTCSWLSHTHARKARYKFGQMQQGEPQNEHVNLCKLLCAQSAIHQLTLAP